ncbi:MAG: DUF115 domain-containing protein, partial [Chloroflexota bacterium]
RRLWKAGIREFEVFGLSGSRSYRVPHLLDEFVNIHKGQRCFVVGNGPSLNELDMGLIKDEISLGANRCYLGYEKWGFSFTYWGIVDRLQIELYATEYEDHIPEETVKFFPFQYLPVLRFENACPINHFYKVLDFPQFSDEPDRVYVGNTVTYMLLQIAAVMGCNPIILIGVDHRYPLNGQVVPGENSRVKGNWWLKRIRQSKWLRDRFRGTLIYDFVRWRRDASRVSKKESSPVDSIQSSRVWTRNDAQSATHFDDRYTGQNRQFVPPRPEKAEVAFRCAADWADRNGIEILNATPNSALDTFPFVAFESLFPK